MKSFRFLPEKISRFVKTAFYVSIWPVWRKSFFERIMVWLSHSDFDQQIFNILSTFFLRDFQSCILRVHRNKLKKLKYFEKKIKIFLSSSDFELDFFGHLLNSFGSVVEIGVFVPWEKIIVFLRNWCFSYRVWTLNEEKMALIQKLCSRKA